MINCYYATLKLKCYEKNIIGYGKGEFEKHATKSLQLNEAVFYGELID